MWSILDSVGNEVTHVWVIMLHVNLATQGGLTFFVAASSHLFELLKLPFNRVVTGWRVNLVLTVMGHLLFGLEAYISKSLFNKFNSDIIQFLEVV